ncbi:MAG TPA: hypothetical protein VJS92_00865 [Candidatus Polarisedimenticolaceae bacterium]|nr:hypothetical protein [Candidatus Polarisedimenticolaceae bacterium]
MDARQLAPGLWRWTAPHPEWRPEKERPGGWWRDVGCVFYEPRAGDGIVLIDPLAPPEPTEEAARFWRNLDRDVARVGRPVAVLLGNFYHERSAQAVYDRYRERPGAMVWAHEAARYRLSCELTHPFLPGQRLPGGVEAHPVAGFEEAEIVYYIGEHQTLVFADAVIGVGHGQLRVAPRSWAPANDAAAERYTQGFRRSLRALLDLTVDKVLVSHGQSVLRDARQALAEALDAPAWGEDS